LDLHDIIGRSVGRSKGRRVARLKDQVLRLANTKGGELISEASLLDDRVVHVRLAAAPSHVHATRIEAIVFALAMATAPVDLNNYLAIRVQDFDAIGKLLELFGYIVSK